MDAAPRPHDFAEVGINFESPTLISIISTTNFLPAEDLKKPKAEVRCYDERDV